MIDLNIGRLLAKRYQVQELIGTGAMGQVYLANDILLGGVPVAVKFLALTIQSPKIQMRERFEREAKTCALLGQKSIHIVRVMDYGVDKELGIPFYVMEYLQGKSLGDVIRLQPLSLARFLSLVRQISLGLQCAHQGILVDGEIYPIIHRDIKPSNIVLIQDSSLGELVKIFDFGIAKLLQPDSDRTNYYLGTLAYSSPEQMEGNELDERSDIYSLGILMFEMLTGKIPLQANTNSFGGWYKAHHFQPPRSFASVSPTLELPLSVKNLVMSCLAKEPSARPQSISKILQTLVSLEHYVEAANANQVIGSAVEAFEQSRLTADECHLSSWPKNKPIADIVFSHTVRTNDSVMTALWVMLPQQEIARRLQSTRYNQFLFITSPHPMMLWITVLYNKHGPKWLPCYLDMRTPQGQEIVRLLGETGYYRLLLFAREAPQQAYACLLLSIAPAQSQRLQAWAETSQTLISPANPQLSKSLLKNEFEKIKPQILMKLEAIHKEPLSDLLG